MAYLAGVWSLFGYSIVVTRVAMLAVGALGVVATWRLAAVLLDDAPAAWLAPGFLLASPWFWSQSMMAQLDMPGDGARTAAAHRFPP